RPALLLLEGEPGIGKSTLWRYGLGQAEQRGWRTLAFRPGEAERSLTFAGLSGLFPDAVLDDVLPAIAEPRRRALETALLRVDGPRLSLEPVLVGLGVVSVVSELARSVPLVLALDDLQWLDEPT